MKEAKDQAIQALAIAVSLTQEETDHRLLRYCHSLLTGEASSEITPDMLVAHAKCATNEVEFHERMAAAYALEGRHNEAVDALRVAAEELRPVSGLHAVPVRIVPPPRPWMAQAVRIF
jgi:hypothetical protein